MDAKKNKIILEHFIVIEKNSKGVLDLVVRVKSCIKHGKKAGVVGQEEKRGGSGASTASCLKSSV